MQALEVLKSCRLRCYRCGNNCIHLYVLSPTLGSLQIWVATIKSHSIGKMSLQIKSCRGSSITFLGMPVFELIGQVTLLFVKLEFGEQEAYFGNNVGWIFCPVMAVLQSSVSLFCNFAIKKVEHQRTHAGCKISRLFNSNRRQPKTRITLILLMVTKTILTVCSEENKFDEL